MIAERRQLQLLRHPPHDLRQLVLHRVDDGERRRPAVARHGQQDAARAVRSHDARLRIEAVVDGGDVLHVDRGAVDGSDWQVVELVDGGQTAVQPDRILDAAEFRGAGGQDQVLEIQGIRDIDWRQPLRVQLIELQVHYDLTALAAERVRHGRSLHCGERRPDEIVAEVEQFLLLEGLTAQPELQNRHAGRIVFEDLRRKSSRRHVADLELALRHDLRDCEIHLSVGVEIDPDGRNALVRL